MRCNTHTRFPDASREEGSTLDTGRTILRAETPSVVYTCGDLSVYYKWITKRNDPGQRGYDVNLWNIKCPLFKSQPRRTTGEEMICI